MVALRLVIPVTTARGKVVGAAVVVVVDVGDAVVGVEVDADVAPVVLAGGGVTLVQPAARAATAARVAMRNLPGDLTNASVGVAAPVRRSGHAPP
jgi:hypothetical protein